MSGMGCSYRGLFPEMIIDLIANIVKGFQNNNLCLRRVGFEDLMQECVTHLWIKTKGDLSRCRYIRAFVRKATKNKLLDIIKRLNTDKRKAMNEIRSLDEEQLTKKGEVSLYEIVSSESTLYPGEMQSEIEQCKFQPKSTPYFTPKVHHYL